MQKNTSHSPCVDILQKISGTILELKITVFKKLCLQMTGISKMKSNPIKIPVIGKCRPFQVEELLIKTKSYLILLGFSPPMYLILIASH